MISTLATTIPLQLADRVLISLTSISGLILVASGLTIIFGLMGVLNLAHGALMMVGAYTAYAVQSAGFSPWLSIVIAPLVVGLVGVAMEVTLIRRLYDRPLDTLLATWGVAIVLQEAVTIAFGTSQKSVAPPMEGSISLLGVTYPIHWAFIIVVAVVVMAITIGLFAYTDIGIMALAVIQDREMAAAVGINTRVSDRTTFAFGSALAGLSGAIMAPLLSVSSTMGISWLADSFLVVIVGGIGTFTGTIAGGVLLGGLDNLFRTVISGYTSIAQAAVLLVALIIIRYRPQGLVPTTGGGE
ncbi:branched-chain amino acid ABC transporter permease [Halobellus inordinatus]|uniref:branched-chain amino acid ABC transporter permease n=1 Tax=Halobellus inordinatus TaxID=1126236 RepID=UPI0021139DA7|nr:branched-chain amino acid ABC transporter permease [Halobellus ramosii]